MLSYNGGGHRHQEKIQQMNEGMEDFQDFPWEEGKSVFIFNMKINMRLSGLYQKSSS